MKKSQQRKIKRDEERKKEGKRKERQRMRGPNTEKRERSIIRHLQTQQRKSRSTGSEFKFLLPNIQIYLRI